MAESASDEVENQLFAAIESGEVISLRAILHLHPNVNIVDTNMMTPLQHAAYKGNKEMVQLLLDYGADPNMCRHQHNYAALHFAGLSGNLEVCLALLIAGAKPELTNAVNRTAAQMAAFVGHHKCVAIINNYVKRSDVDYYTVIQGQQKEPYLPPFLAESFHQLIIQVTVHPVKIAMNMYSYIGIAQHLVQVKKVLELMCEKEMKREAESNEVMAFKFHYLSYIAGQLIKLQDKQKGDQNKKSDVLQDFCKHILKPGKEGALDILESFLKDCVKNFPYRECTLFRQMVSTLTGKDAPSALSVVTSAINGQRGFIDNVPLCCTCGEEKPSKKCSQCKVVQYCDKNCQKLHWHWHKKVCSTLAQESQKSNEIDKVTEVDTAELSSEIKKLLV